MGFLREHRGKRPPPAADDHDSDEIVELTRTKFVSEAVVITEALEAAGIRTAVSENLVPQMLSAQGNRIMVFAHDLDKAGQVLSEIEQQSPIEPEVARPAVTKHLRHRAETSE